MMKAKKGLKEGESEGEIFGGVYECKKNTYTKFKVILVLLFTSEAEGQHCPDQGGQRA